MLYFDQCLFYIYYLVWKCIGNKKSAIVSMLFILSYLQMLVLSLILLFQTTSVACKCCTK